MNNECARYTRDWQKTRITIFGEPRSRGGYEIDTAFDD